MCNAKEIELKAKAFMSIGKVDEAHEAYRLASDVYTKGGDVDNALRCRYESTPFWMRGHTKFEREVFTT
jgi:hypothetical protein